MSVTDFGTDKKIVIEQGDNDYVSRTVRSFRMDITVPAPAGTDNFAHGISAADYAAIVPVNIWGYVICPGPIYVPIPNGHLNIYVTPTVVTVTNIASGIWNSSPAVIFVEYIEA